MAKKLDTSDNVYTSEENKQIEFLKKSQSVKAWFFFFLWGLLSLPIMIKWAIWGSDRFPWAKAYGQVSLMWVVLITIPYLIITWPIWAGLYGLQ